MRRRWIAGVAVASVVGICYALALSTSPAIFPAPLRRIDIHQIWMSGQPRQLAPLAETWLTLESPVAHRFPVIIGVLRLVLHLVNAGLLWVVLSRLQIPGGGVAASLFSLHPASVIIVLNPSGIEFLLSAFWALLATLCWLRYISADRPDWTVWLWLCQVAYAVSLLCGNATLLLPVFLLLLTAWSRQRPVSVAGRELVGSLLLAGVVAWAGAYGVTWLGTQNIVHIPTSVPAWNQLALSLVDGLPAALVPFGGDQIAALPSDAGLWGIASVMLVAAVLVLLPKAWSLGGLLSLGGYAIFMVPVLARGPEVEELWPTGVPQYLALASLLAGAISSGYWLFGGASATAALRWNRVILAATLLAFWTYGCWHAAYGLGDPVRFWQMVTRRAPDHATAQQRLAEALLEQDQPAAAVDHFRRAVSLAPRNAAAHGGLGIALLRLGKLNDGLEQLQRAVRIAPDDPLGHANLATGLAVAGRHRDAMSHLAYAKIADPDIVDRQLPSARMKMHGGDSLTLLGEEMAKRGNAQAAELHLRRAIEIEPKYAPAHEKLGTLLLRQGQVEAAQAHLRIAVYLDPTSGTAHQELAKILEAVGAIDDAIVHYQWAIDRCPDCLTAKNNLAWLLATSTVAERRDVPRAVRLAEQLMQADDPPEPAYMDTLAVAYAASGRFELAIATANQALALARGSGGDPALVGQIEAHLMRFRDGKTVEQ